jgi:hypothetical protein
VRWAQQWGHDAVAISALGAAAASASADSIAGRNGGSAGCNDSKQCCAQPSLQLQAVLGTAVAAYRSRSSTGRGSGGSSKRCQHQQTQLRLAVAAFASSAVCSSKQCCLKLRRQPQQCSALLQQDKQVCAHLRRQAVLCAALVAVTICTVRTSSISNKAVLGGRQQQADIFAAVGATGRMQHHVQQCRS